MRGKEGVRLLRGGEGKGREGREREKRGGKGEDERALPPLSEILNTPLVVGRFSLTQPSDPPFIKLRKQHQWWLNNCCRYVCMYYMVSNPMAMSNVHFTAFTNETKRTDS